jgi:hypothetical protein
MSNRFAPRTAIATLAFLAAMAVACSDKAVTGPDSSVTAGLTRDLGNDTATTTPANAGPGYFHGTVLGSAPEIAGADSLALFPKLAGVVVTIYPLIATAGDSMNPANHGPAAGLVVTDVAGQFQLPTLAAGNYLVTFVPPSTSGYHGVYAFGPLRSNSKDYPWWVVLSKN